MVARPASHSAGTVVVAVNFGEQTPYLIDSAVDLCRRSGLGLRLMHVLVPPPPALWYGEITAGLKLADLAEAELEISRVEATGRLEALAKAVPADVERDVVVLSDDLASGIFAELDRLRAKLLICGSVGGSYRFVPKSLSTVLTLVSESPVPVLVLHDGAPHVFPKETVKLLVMDDLADATGNTFHSSFGFLSHVRSSEILHLHVSGLNKAALAAALTAANAAGRNGTNLESEVDDVFSVLHERSLARLKNRSKNLQVQTGAGVIKYDAKVVYGNIHEAMDQVIREFKPDILCFGKHKGIHRKPFALGQVPYSSMLAYHLPILILG